MLKKKILKLVIGSNNQGKIKEIRDLLPNYIQILAPSDYNLRSPKENGKTFEQNSLIKAKFFSKQTKMICLADDSGLEIDILNQSKIAIEAARKLTKIENNATRDHILLLAPNYPIEVAFYMPLIQRHYSKTPIQSWRVLSLAPFNHTFLRTDSNTIQMHVENGELLSTMLEQLFRSPLSSFKTGEEISI